MPDERVDVGDYLDMVGISSPSCGFADRRVGSAPPIGPGRAQEAVQQRAPAPQPGDARAVMTSARPRAVPVAVVRLQVDGQRAAVPASASCGKRKGRSPSRW